MNTALLRWILFPFIPALIFTSACRKEKDIPIEKMASIIYAMILDHKITKDKDPAVLEDAVIEPYAQKEGYTAADFKYTALLLEKNPQKNSELAQKIGALLLDDLLRNIDTTQLKKMIEELPDSSTSAPFNEVP